ncbi:hypothetical protein [Conexivisphaera calida]|uniref:Uncharacterized protein n=1 Tax=Conexivisphaera calida TaxID=1874277 RepID=A0A4P2VPG2_9ARCH|nr:hypothetical protein [Conexivisphaera calida]BBE42775.1 hypothetical protein NAS2_1388 [Conexivisphaera calida]
MELVGVAVRVNKGIAAMDVISDGSGAGLGMDPRARAPAWAMDPR